jgi:hypothetical protein
MSEFPIGWGGDRHIGYIAITPASARYHHIHDFCHIFRSLAPSNAQTFGVGLVLSTSVAVIWKAPIDDPDVDYPIGLFDPENLRIFSPHDQNCIEIEDRLLSSNPAQFTLEDLITGEMIGHKARNLACFCQDSTERSELFNKAFKIYESLIMVCDKIAAQDQYKKISGDPSQGGWVFPRYGREQPSEDGCTRRQQCISRIFAGMAVCELMGARSIERYRSFSSAAIYWAAGRALELACCLRVFPYVIATRLQENDADECDIHNLLNMTYQITANVLLPLTLELGRRDMFDQELQVPLYADSPECRAVCERVAAQFNEPSGLNAVTCMNFRLVRGRFIERVCAKCSKHDSRNDFKLCSTCRGVFYCGKECQIAHWKEHKSVCKLPDN